MTPRKRYRSLSLTCGSHLVIHLQIDPLNGEGEVRIAPRNENFFWNLGWCVEPSANPSEVVQFKHEFIKRHKGDEVIGLTAQKKKKECSISSVYLHLKYGDVKGSIANIITEILLGEKKQKEKRKCGLKDEFLLLHAEGQ